MAAKPEQETRQAAAATTDNKKRGCGLRAVRGRQQVAITSQVDGVALDHTSLTTATCPNTPTIKHTDPLTTAGGSHPRLMWIMSLECDHHVCLIVARALGRRLKHQPPPGPS